MNHEVNINALVGPTHTFSGLSWGNEASVDSKDDLSNPRKAALQGLAHMKFLHDLGLKQLVLPPHERPYNPLLKELGFETLDEHILEKVFKESPSFLRTLSSASAMWVANAAVWTPSSDTSDKKVHLTPANLVSKLHRAIEADMTASILKKVFPNKELFTHHAPLPSHNAFGDEGAANHIRFAKDDLGPGIHLFVYGQTHNNISPTKYPARQTELASKSIALRHGLNKDQVVFARQNPEAIDAGVFHNDVISTGHLNFYLYHEKSFFETDSVVEEIQSKLMKISGIDLIAVKVKESEVSLKEAVSSYLFNSQIISDQKEGLRLLAPKECSEQDNVRNYIERLIADPHNPITKVDYIDLNESMKNGGGPACLRLRAQMSELEFQAVNPGVILTDNLYGQLVNWIQRHYRERLSPADLIDYQLVKEGQIALNELTAILKLGNLYSFQK